MQLSQGRGEADIVVRGRGPHVSVETISARTTGNGVIEGIVHGCLGRGAPYLKGIGRPKLSLLVGSTVPPLSLIQFKGKSLEGRVLISGGRKKNSEVVPSVHDTPPAGAASN